MAKIVNTAYGEALFELALEKNTIDTCAEEIRFVKSAFAENVDLVKILTHPKISREEKIKIIENIFKGRVSDDITGLLVLVTEKGHAGDFNGIFDEFLAKVREYKKIGVAFVTSAMELSQEQKKQIEQKLLKTTEYVKFEMNYGVDASLIGGLVIRIGDRVVDNSIKTKLSLLSQKLSKIQLS